MEIESAPHKASPASGSKAEPAVQKPTRLNGLDGFRGFFTFFVVLIHMRVDFAICKNSFVYIGYFFTLSGLLVTSNTLHIFEKKGTFDSLEFWKRRIARIIPQAYLVILAISVSVAISLLLFPDALTRIDVYWLRQDMLWALFYGSNWQGIEKGDDYFAQFEKIPILRHYWSLSIEEQYYIVWPVLFSLWLYAVVPVVRYISERWPPSSSSSITSPAEKEYRHSLLALLLGEVVVFVASLLYQHHLMAQNTPYYVLHYSTLVLMKELALGGGMAVGMKLSSSLRDVMFSPRRYTPQLSFMQRILVELVLVVLFVYILVYPSTLPTDTLFRWYFSSGAIEMGLALGVSVVLIALQTQELNDREHEYKWFPLSQCFFASKAVAYTGMVSYAVYLWHLPILVWLKIPEMEHKSAVYLGVIFVLIFAVSHITAFFYEYPAQKVILKHGSKKVIYSLPVAMVVMAVVVLAVTSSYEDPYGYSAMEKGNAVVLDGGDMGSDSKSLFITTATPSAAPAATFLRENSSVAVLAREQTTLGSHSYTDGYAGCPLDSSQDQSQSDYLSYLIGGTFSHNLLEGEVRALLHTWDNVRTYNFTLKEAFANTLTERKSNSSKSLKSLVLQGMRPRSMRKVAALKSLEKLNNFRQEVCSEVSSLVTEVALTSNHVGQDDVFVLYIVDSVYTSLMGRIMGEQGKSIELWGQEDKDRVTEGITVPRSAPGTTLCQGWAMNEITQIDTRPGEGRVFVVAIDVRDAMAYDDKRFSGLNSAGRTITLSPEHAQYHSLMWYGMLEEENLESPRQTNYFRYISYLMVKHAVRIAPELAPFFDFCEAHEGVWRGVEIIGNVSAGSGAGTGGDVDRDSVSKIVDPALSSHANTAGKEIQTVLYYGDSVAVRMSVLMEDARKDHLRHCPTAAVQGGGDSAVAEYIKHIKFSCLEKSFYFSNPPRTWLLWEHDNVVSRKKKAHLTEKYVSFIKSHKVSTVIMSFSSVIVDVVRGQHGKNQGIGFFMHELLELHNLGIKRVYVQDSSVPLDMFKENPEAVKSFNYSDPHALHRKFLESFTEYFVKCEVYLRSWDGEIDGSGMGACMTSSKYFLEKASARAKVSRRKDKGATLSNGNIYHLAFRDIKAMIVFLELSFLTCPQILSDTKKCSNKGWGYNPLLADGLHPSGHAGRFIAKGELGVLARDMFIRDDGGHGHDLDKSESVHTTTHSSKGGGTSGKLMC